MEFEESFVTKVSVLWWFVFVCFLILGRVKIVHNALGCYYVL